MTGMGAMSLAPHPDSPYLVAAPLPRPDRRGEAIILLATDDGTERSDVEKQLTRVLVGPDQLHYATRVGADLIATGTHGRGFVSSA